MVEPHHDRRFWKLQIETITRPSHVFAGLFFLLLVTSAGSVCPPAFEHIGNSEALGLAVAAAGDVDGDGYADYILGASSNDSVASNAGAAYVISGFTKDTLFLFTGEAGGDEFGGAVASAGDVNNDGTPDFIIGAHKNDAAGSGAGRAYVFSGVDGDTLYVFDGPSGSGQNFGWAVASAGDVNNDNFDDVIIGAPADGGAGNPFPDGRAYVFSGIDGDTLYIYDGTGSDDDIGRAVAPAGDFNSDGFDDFVIGAPNLLNGPYRGATFLFSGIDGDTLLSFYAQNNRAGIGYSIAVADVDFDGTVDFVMGNDPLWTPHLALVMSGATEDTLYIFQTLLPGSYGSSVAAGDFNGDNYADILIGDYEDQENGPLAGKAFLFSGFDGDTLYTINGPSGKALGYATAFIGDYNNDGYDDFIAGGVDLAYVVNGHDASIDTDTDGTPDGCDNCPSDSNPGQENLDGDAFGDICDNCPSRFNPSQEDYDLDGLGDSCYLPVVIRPMTIVIREYFPPGANPEQFNRMPPTNPELNLIVYDPEGFVIGADSLNNIFSDLGDSASYSNIGAEDSVQINDPKTGEYTIVVVPEVGSNQSGRSYVIGIRTDGTVENVFGPSDSPLSGETDTLIYNTTPLMGDTDGDGALDGADNCVTVTNPGQEDLDGDGYGDSCYIYAEYNPLTVVARDATDPETDPEVNLYITDPDGLVIGADSLDNLTNTIGLSATYTQIDANDSVVIEPVKVGEYQVEIIPEANQTGGSTVYVIGIRTDGTIENVFGPSPTPTSGEVDTLSHNATSYLAGDCDGTKSINIADATYMIARIFAGGPDCQPAASGDADCSGSFNIADVTFLLARIFSGGPPPGCY